jgi:AraC-like DNA-binding protein
MLEKRNEPIIPADPCASDRAVTRMPPVCVKCLNINGRRLTHQIGQGAGCGIVCCLAGRISVRLTTNGKTTDLTIMAGSFGLYNCPRDDCRAVLTSAEGAQILYLLISRSVLGVLPGNCPLFRGYAKPEGDAFPVTVHEITRDINLVIGSIQDVPLQDHNANLLLLAKALEFLWLHLTSKQNVGEQGLNPSDYRAIQKARNVLLTRLEDPPSLNGLARTVGMSASKLKLLFPRGYGMPPYRYLHKLRMQKALEALTRDGMNVTEAAMAVGYSNISYFAKAFKREHGILPSEARRRFLAN